MKLFLRVLGSGPRDQQVIREQSAEPHRVPGQLPSPFCQGKLLLFDFATGVPPRRF